MSKKLNRIKRTPLDIWSKPSYSKSIIESEKFILIFNEQIYKE